MRSWGFYDILHHEAAAEDRGKSSHTEETLRVKRRKSLKNRNLDLVFVVFHILCNTVTDGELRFLLMTSWSRLAQATPFVRSGSNLFRNCQRGRGRREEGREDRLTLCVMYACVCGIRSQLLVTTSSTCAGLCSAFLNVMQMRKKTVWCKCERLHQRCVCKHHQLVLCNC